MILFDKFIIRFKASIVYLAAIAGVLLSHMNLLHLSHRGDDVVQLVCLLVMALNNPVASKIQERK